MLVAGNKTLLKAELTLCLTNTTTPQKGAERTEHKHHSQNPRTLCSIRTKQFLLAVALTAPHFYMLTLVANGNPKVLISDMLIALTHMGTNRRTVSHVKKKKFKHATSHFVQTFSVQLSVIFKQFSKSTVRSTRFYPAKHSRVSVSIPLTLVEKKIIQ
jgi:hypothetical protein